MKPGRSEQIQVAGIPKKLKQIVRGEWEPYFCFKFSDFHVLEVLKQVNMSGNQEFLALIYQMPARTRFLRVGVGDPP